MKNCKKFFSLITLFSFLFCTISYPLQCNALVLQNVPTYNSLEDALSDSNPPPSFMIRYADSKARSNASGNYEIWTRTKTTVLLENSFICYHPDFSWEKNVSEYFFSQSKSIGVSASLSFAGKLMTLSFQVSAGSEKTTGYSIQVNNPSIYRLTRPAIVADRVQYTYSVQTYTGAGIKIGSPTTKYGYALQRQYFNVAYRNI